MGDGSFGMEKLLSLDASLRTQVEVPDYSTLNEDGQPTQLVVELDPKKDLKQNADLCFKQAAK